jgi:hypothetical protein
MHYGEPIVVAVEDELIFQSTSKIDDEFRQSVSKREYSLKPVTFEENPTCIIWKSPYFQLTMRQDFEHKAIQVVYKKLI